MSEDERYRQSTQYRLWSYTPASLAAQRAQTNAFSAQRVQAVVARVRAQRAELSSADTSENDVNKGASLPEGEVQCLTPDEELKLLWYYCGRTLAMGDHLNLPTEVKSTAVQYLRRFYITNSIMTYAPADILKTALFFATKTENYYVKLTKFAEAIGHTTAEDVLASEFLLTQGLRFTFDVRHPFRALEGVCMEIHAMAQGDELTFPHGGGALHERPDQLEKRNKQAHHVARGILKTNAQLTDVYFHFTPSQIMLAALAIADGHLVTWYLSTKFPPATEEPSDNVLSLFHKIMETVQKCVDMLQTVQPREDMELTASERKIIKPLSKKLSKCRNPEKMDLVALQRAKREGEIGEDERQAKKRKLEREMSAKEGEDLFGPSIQR